MLSRRSLRIKVMQTLFASEQQGGASTRGLRKLLNDQIDHARRAYLYHFVFLEEVAAQVSREADIIAGKYLPTDKDKKFSTRFSEIKFVKDLEENEAFKKHIEKEKLRLLIDSDMVRYAYKELKASEAYAAFVAESDPDNQSDQRHLKSFFETVWWPSDDFSNHMESHFPSWEEDIDWVINKVQNCFQQGKLSLKMEIPEESITFCIQLMDQINENKESFEEMIAPRLTNWEIDRVSIMDRLLIKMALAELLYMDTIPVKVTINEYIDISKSYSSPKSKEFINGVLDNLLKDLKEAGKIKKRGRGLVE